MGVPAVAEWPEFQDLPLVRDGSIDLPHRSSCRRLLLDTFGYLSDVDLQLVASLVQYESTQSWMAEKALQSPYYHDDPVRLLSRDMPRF